MTKSFVSVNVDEDPFFTGATITKLHGMVDDQIKFNRHYYGWTAALLATIVLGGGGLLCYWISTLPIS